MALWRSKGAGEDATRGTAPIEVRKSDALLVTGAGVLPGSTSPLVTGTAGWAYQVGAAGFVTSRGTSDGVHLFGNDGAVTVGTTGAGSTVPVAPGAGLSRIDIVWVRHPAAGENSDTTSEPVFGVTSGTAASSPVAPTIPTGALELARNTMTSAATTTASAGNSIAQTAAVTRLKGQQTPARSIRASAGTLGINAWLAATDPLDYTFQQGGWYLINAAGTAQTGGSAATLRHRIRAAGLDVSGEFWLTANPGSYYALAGHHLFQASATATVQVVHELYVPGPATGINVQQGHAISVVRVA